MHNNDKKLILKFNSKLFEINLRNTETARLIAESVPIKSKIQVWGEEIFFNTNLQVKLEDDARDVMQLGELAFWTEGSAIAIGYGKTPVSVGQEIRLIGPCNVWADCRFKKSDFDNVKSGDKISLDWK
tara:strand:- start:116 stop:499 length:384 start_codon:yes stop_codon:yes gene_type:complete